MRYRVLGRALTWLYDPEHLIFAVLILLHVIPIWGFTYFPSQDGPAHLHNATVIRDYAHPDRPIYREYYLLDLHPDPNWLIYLILVGLMSFVPVLVAEKLLLAGYVILLPIALRYALQAIRPASAFLSVLAFPLVYNFTLLRSTWASTISRTACHSTSSSWATGCDITTGSPSARRCR
jgi:hypothetical protein